MYQNKFRRLKVYRKNMSDRCVDYQDVVERYSRELSPSRDELVVLPEPAGDQVVDYMAVSERWKEEKARMLRVPGGEDD